MKVQELLLALIDLLLDLSVKFGDFTLASGRKSNVYADVRLTSMTGRGQVLIGHLGLAMIEESFPGAELVGGLTLGADPIAYAIAHRATLEGIDGGINAFTVRKEQKTHGTGKRIEGVDSVRGKKVVIIEDVVTTGASALLAAEAVKTEGGEVLGVLALLERQDGGRARIEEAGYRLVSVVQGDRVITRAKERGIVVPPLISIEATAAAS